jgi:C1A family cysteine protease
MSLIRKIARYGWKPDFPDHRDRLFRLHRRGGPTLPPAINLLDKLPAVKDQGDLGSCTGNGISTILGSAAMAAGGGPFDLSRLFIYYNERVTEGTVNEDSGAQIRDGLKSVAELGACLEEAWPYDVSQFTVKPPDYAYFDAKQRRAISYHSVAQDEGAIKECLADGFPIVFGFTVYESFESGEVARTGVVQMPGRRHDNVVGGHCVVLAGYRDSDARFLVRNSWGTDWGQGGNFTIPYAYILDADLANDFWTVRAVALP